MARSCVTSIATMTPAQVSTLLDAPACNVIGSWPTSDPRSPQTAIDSSPPPEIPPSSQSSDAAYDVPHSFVKEALNVVVILYEIVKKLPNPAHIVMSKRVARAWYAACALALQRHFRINDALADYFWDVIGFRRVQCELEVLISGSFALAFFREYDNDGRLTMGKKSDMDLFVEWTLAEQLELFLTDNGYKLLYSFTNPLPDEESTTPVASIPDDSFTRVVRYNRGDKNIDVVCTTDTPVYCVFRFHSTVVMNFITWNRAYSMFPLDTLFKNRGLVLRLNNDRTRAAIDKYRARGFEMIEIRLALTNTFSDSLRAAYRWVGDTKCWTVELNVDDIASSVDPYTGLSERTAVATGYPYSINGFRLEWAPVAGPTWTGDIMWCPSQDCDLVVHGALVYTYAAGPPFHEQLMRYLRRRAEIYGPHWKSSSRRISHVDDLLQCVKDDYIRCSEDSTAVPHHLYG